MRFLSGILVTMAMGATACGGGNCPAGENQLTGSVSELFDIGVDRVRVRQVDASFVAVEFFHGNDTTAKVLADVSAFAIGAEIPLSNGAVRRITSPETLYPSSISRGIIRFDNALSAGSEVSGCFSCLFNMNDGSQRTLNGGFRATMEGL